jgi:hypothetical protein
MCRVPIGRTSRMTEGARIANQRANGGMTAWAAYELAAIVKRRDDCDASNSGDSSVTRKPAMRCELVRPRVPLGRLAAFPQACERKARP